MNCLNSTFKSLCLVITFFVIIASQSLHAQQLAFPSAYGAGAYTSGGRGGEVIHVTNLNDNGSGSLRAALSMTFPRTIVFDVSGVINLSSLLYLDNSNSNVTVAGQTSPEGGITLIGARFYLNNVNNIIVRHIRFKGGVSADANPNNDDNYGNDSFSAVNSITNQIFDHCTFAFGADESASWYATGNGDEINNVTIQNCLFAENIKGSIIGKQSGTSGLPPTVSFNSNLFYNSGYRFPNIAGDNARIDILNNVVWNADGRLIRGNGNFSLNQIGNYYNYGNTLLRNTSLNVFRFGTVPQIYSSDNHIVAASTSDTELSNTVPQINNNNQLSWKFFLNGGGFNYGDQLPANYFANTQHELLGRPLPLLTGEESIIQIPQNVGCDSRLNADGTVSDNKDVLDANWLNLVNEGVFTPKLPTNQYVVPPIETTTRPVDFYVNNPHIPEVWFSNNVPDGQNHNDIAPSGYTWLEEYLNGVDAPAIVIGAIEVEITPNTATLNVPETLALTRVFIPEETTNKNGVWISSNEEVATVSANGTVSSLAEGETTITFISDDNNTITDEAIITVTNIIIPLETVTITSDTNDLDLNASLQLATEFFPTNTTDVSGMWSSSDEAIAIVDQNGLVTSLGEGEVEISFTATDNGITDSIIITVEDVFFGSYFLYNAISDELIQNIEGDVSINLEEQGNQINFRSIPEGGDDNPNVESIRVTWTGPADGVWVESVPLYAGMPGGHVGLNFEPYTVEEGTYNFTVTYYSENSASGSVVAIDTFALSFFFSSLPVADAGPDQEICEGETATLVASGGANFLWDNGETTDSISVNPAETTTYSVIVSDDEGNTDEASVIVTVNAIPIAEAGENQTICQGETATLTATGGDSYLWSTGETTATIEVIPTEETIYSVEVSSNDCVSNDDVTVFVNPLPTISITEDMVIIEGESATLTATENDNFEWSTGEITPSITVTPNETTTYTVSTLGLNGCVNNTSTTVTVIPEVVANAGDDVTICNGDTVTLLAEGGSTYTWNTGDISAELVVSPSETTTYIVTVEDDYGYTDTDEVTVIVNDTPAITFDDAIFVMIGNTATLSVNGASTYEWSTGETTSEILVSPNVTTTYTVTGTAENGCQNSVEITVTVIEQISANAGEDMSICIGEDVTLNASGGVTYSWNTGDTGFSPTFSPTETTTYTVTVTDGFGNSDSDDVTITVNPLPIANAGDDQTICQNQFVTLTAEGGDTYLWNTGETTSSIEVNPNTDTTYTVEVFTNGCSDSDSVLVTVLPIPEITVSDDIIIEANSSTTLEVFGGDSFLWNTGETSNAIVVSPSQSTTYSVTSFLENGCETTLEVIVTVVPEVIANASEDINICAGESVTLNASGSSNYLWSTGETTSSILVNPSQTSTYSVTVSDNFGNSDTDSVTVTVNEIPTINLTEDTTIFEGESIELSIDGADNYLWSTGETTSSINVIPTETITYSVTAFSDNNCQVTNEVTVTVIPEVIANAGNDREICIGTSIILSATGGSNYSWNTGETLSVITVSPQETTTYVVTVSDNFGNSDSDSVTITVNDLPNLTTSPDITIFEGETTNLSANGAETYLWSTGASSNSIVVSPDETTTYTVIGSTASNCEVTSEVTVTVIPEVIANAGNDVEICAGESVTLTASGSSNYVWSTGDTTASVTLNPLVTTTYTVIVSNDFGNSDIDSVTIIVNELPSLSLSDNITIFEGESTELIVSGADAYSWDTGDTSNSIVVSPMQTTSYSVTGFSENGCQVTDEVTVTVVPQVIANAGEDVSICAGESVTLNATGNGNYEWNTGATSASITLTPTQTTTYNVTVTNSFGNSDTDSVTVTVNELPILTISQNQTIIEGESIDLSVNGAATYLWNTGETSSIISVNPTETTTYSVTGFSVNGCEASEEIIVTVIPAVIADAGEDVSICFGDSVTLNASGGTTYSWNNGGTGATRTFSPTETTTYTVTVFDTFGNSDSDSVTVTVNELPIITVSENITIVEGESANLTVNGAENYIWSTGDSSSSITVSPTQTTTYSVSGSTNDCSSEVLQVIVTVEPLFVASAGADERVCDNQTSAVVLTANEGDSYLWSTGETTQSITVNPTSTVSYTVTVTNNGQQDADDVTVYVDPSPDVIVANGDSVDILNGDFITLSASGANTYEWSNGATQPNIAVSPAVTTTYEVRGYIGDCYDDKEVVVNVYQPVIADAGEDVMICLEDVTTLTASGGDEYVWSTGETTQSIQVSPEETTDYTVTVFNPLDFDEATVTVEIDANCAGQTVINPIGIPMDFNFEVFPNPASEIVNIKFSGVFNVSDVHIYEVTGKLIQRVQISNENVSLSTTRQIDVSSLKSGVYFVKLIGEEKDITKKLIIR